VILTIIWWLRKLDKLSVSEWAAWRFGTETLNLKRLNGEVKEQYQVKISNRFSALEYLGEGGGGGGGGCGGGGGVGDININKASESTRRYKDFSHRGSDTA